MGIFQQSKCLFLFLIVSSPSLQSSLNINAGNAPGSPSVLSQSNKSGVNSHTSVLSDFDGDSRSDLATGKSEGDINRVEMQLSALQKGTTFNFGDSQTGIRLLACA